MIVNPTDYNWTPFNSNGVQKGIKKTDSSVVIYRFVGSGSGIYMYAYDSNTIDNIISNVVGGIPDGVVVNGGIDVSDIANGNITTGVFEYRLTVGGVQQTYTSNSTDIFSGIALSSANKLRVIAFYGDANGDTIKLEGPEGDGTTMPIQPANTTLLGYTVVSDNGAGNPIIDESNFAKLNQNNTFTENIYLSGFQKRVQAPLLVAKDIIQLRRKDNGGVLLQIFEPSGAGFVFFAVADASQNYYNVFSIDSTIGKTDFKVIPSINGSDISTVSYVDAGLATKLDITAYNQYYRGKFISKAALDANVFNPPLKAGDYAQVDAGSGTPVVNYNWDADDNQWVAGGSGSGAANTDALPEGTNNLYFTVARVLATLLTGYTVGTNTALAATDSILAAFGKIQAQLNGKMTQRTITGTTNQVNVSNGDGVSGNPTLSLPQNIHTAATPQFSGLGLGLASSANARLATAASTSTIASWLLTFGSAYTSGGNGSIWGETANWRVRMVRNAVAGDFIFSNANFLLSGLGNVGLVSNNSGDIGTVPLVDRLTDTNSAKTANYTVLLSDFGANGTAVIWANPASANITITLPNVADMSGLTVCVKNLSATYSVVISGNANIDGSSTYTLTALNASATVKSNGTIYGLF